MSAHPNIKQQSARPKKFGELKHKRRSRSIEPDGSFKFGRHTDARAERKAMFSKFSNEADNESVNSLGSFRARKLPNFYADSKAIVLNERQLTSSIPVDLKTEQKSLSRQESKQKRLQVSNIEEQKQPAISHNVTKQKVELKEWSREEVTAGINISIGKLDEIANDLQRVTPQSEEQTPNKPTNTNNNTFNLS